MSSTASQGALPRPRPRLSPAGELLWLWGDPQVRARLVEVAEGQPQREQTARQPADRDAVEHPDESPGSSGEGAGGADAEGHPTDDAEPSQAPLLAAADDD